MLINVSIDLKQLQKTLCSKLSVDALCKDAGKSKEDCSYNKT